MNSISVCLLLLGICCLITADASIGGWSEWRCQEQGEFCFKGRTCNSTANFTCPKTNDIDVTGCPCVAEWSSWGKWTCRQDHDICLNIRYRTCVNGFTQNGCSYLKGRDFETSPCEEDNICKNNDTVSKQTGGWSDWRCEKHGNFCFKARTCNSTAGFNCTQRSEISVINCPCIAEWSSWGGWTCHPEKLLCLKIRRRTCKSGLEENGCSNLKGGDYEAVLCDETCNVTSSTPAPQSVLSSSTSTSTITSPTKLVIAKETTNTALVYPGLYTTTSTDVTTLTSMASISSSQIPHSTSAATAFISNPQPTRSELKSSTPSTALFSTTLNQRNISSNTATSTPLSTSKPMVASTTAYIYWLEWTGWECKNFTVCVMSRTRNCSTYITDDCEKKLGGNHFHVETCTKEICPVNWLEWSNWTCKIEKDGSCNKTRSRKCSTGSDAQCGLDSLEHKPCDNVTCPELNKLGQLGYCGQHDSSRCLDSDTCKNPSIQLICLADAHVASKICPKACGCCHVDPKWSSWSDWRCERTKTMCRMKQSRTCSTGNTTDCEGISEREAVCDESLCPEPTWESWSKWKCQLRPNNTCTMSRSRKCSNEDFCMGNTQEEDDCSRKECPDFVDFKVDCSLHSTKSDACVDGVGCHFFENAPKTLCLDDAVACPVTCGCCLLSNSSGGTPTPTLSSVDGSTGTNSGVTPKNPIGVTTHNPSVSGGNDSNRTSSGVTTNIQPGVTTQNPSGSNINGSNGTGSGGTTNNPISVTTQNPSVSGGSGSNVAGSGVTTNNPISVTTHNPYVSGGSGSNVTGSGVTTNNPISVTTQNPSVSGGSGSNVTGSGVTTGSGVNGSTGTGSGITTNNPISVTTQNPSVSGGSGTKLTGSAVTTNYPISVTTHNPSVSGGSGSNVTGSGVTTNNPISVTTQKPPVSGGSGSNVTGSGVTTGSGVNGSTGTGSEVTTNNPISITKHNPSGSGGNGSTVTGSGITTNNPISVTTPNPSGSNVNGSTGTDSGVTTNNSIGVTTQNQSGSGVNGSTGTGSEVTTNNPINVTKHNPTESGGHGSTVPGSGITTDNPISVTTHPSGSNVNGSTGTDSGVTTNNPIGVTTQNSSESGVNGSTGTGSEITTTNPISVTKHNPSGSGVNGSTGTWSGVTTNNPISVTTHNPTGSGGNGSNGTGSGVATNNPPVSGGNGTSGTGSGNEKNNASNTVAPTPPSIITSPSTIKTTTTTQKQPHTPTPAAVTCNVCAGPEFLCEKLFAPQTCSPPNNYCINKLTNHIDGTRMVTRHCGNFDTCYREWFLGSSDSDKCRNFEDNNIITLDFDCTYCCTSDDCNKPIKPLDKDLYKDL